MNTDDMILISVDDHVVEPPNLFDGRIPKRWRDAAPQLARNEAAAMHGCSRERRRTTSASMR